MRKDVWFRSTTVANGLETGEQTIEIAGTEQIFCELTR